MSNFILVMSDNISMNYSVINRNFKHENEYKKKTTKNKTKTRKVTFKYD